MMGGNCDIKFTYICAVMFPCFSLLLRTYYTHTILSTSKTKKIGPVPVLQRKGDGKSIHLHDFVCVCALYCNISSG